MTLLQKIAVCVVSLWVFCFFIWGMCSLFGPGGLLVTIATAGAVAAGFMWHDMNP